jgi:hypothetical protein
MDLESNQGRLGGSDQPPSAPVLLEANPHHRLPAGMHMDVLDRDFLLAHSILKAMPVVVDIRAVRF